MSCQNNCKQIGIALHNYHDTHKSFPPAALWGNKIGIPQGPYHHTWLTKILPFMEQNTLYGQMDQRLPAWNLAANLPQLFARQQVPTLMCPTDAGFRGPSAVMSVNGNGQWEVGLTCYAGSVGFTWARNFQVQPGDARFPSTWVRKELSGVFSDEQTTDMATITDGSSNTIMVAEVSTTGFKPAAGVANTFQTCGTGVPCMPTDEATFRAAFIAAGYDGECCNGKYTKPDGTPAVPQQFFKVAPNMHQPTYAAAWGPNSDWPGPSSWHPGTINVIMADASVQSISETIPWDVWMILNGKRDGLNATLP
jgi:hypothetical protein